MYTQHMRYIYYYMILIHFYLVDNKIAILQSLLYCTAMDNRLFPSDPCLIYHHHKVYTILLKFSKFYNLQQAQKVWRTKNTPFNFTDTALLQNSNI